MRRTRPPKGEVIAKVCAVLLTAAAVLGPLPARARQSAVTGNYDSARSSTYCVDDTTEGWWQPPYDTLPKLRCTSAASSVDRRTGVFGIDLRLEPPGDEPGCCSWGIGEAFFMHSISIGNAKQVVVEARLRIDAVRAWSETGLSSAGVRAGVSVGPCDQEPCGSGTVLAHHPDAPGSQDVDVVLRFTYANTRDLRKLDLRLGVDAWAFTGACADRPASSQPVCTRADAGGIEASVLGRLVSLSMSSL